MRRPTSLSFAQALTLHLVRGVVGALALAGAFWTLGAHWAASAAIAAALVVVALVAWRGCPTCWLMGLVGMCSGDGQSCPAPRRKG
jgi:hypothetical protein